MADHKEFYDDDGRKGKSKLPPQAIRLGGDEGSGFDLDERERTAGRDQRQDEEDALLRAWCEKYAADPGLLKSMVMPFVVWGWDIEGLTTGESSQTSAWWHLG
jgi:hypothetical protein